MIETGFILVPLAGVSFLTAAATGRAQRGLPLRASMVAGFVLQLAGMLALRGLDPSTSVASLAPGLVLAGAGIGLINPLATFAGVGVLPPEQGGLASALNNTARQLGLAIGIAVLQAQLRGDLAGAAATAGPRRDDVLDALADGNLSGALARVPAGAREALRAAYDRAYSSGVDDLLLVAAGITLLGAVLTAALVRARDLWTPPVAPAQTHVEPDGMSMEASIR